MIRYKYPLQKYFCMKASMSVNIALNSWLLLQKIYLGVIAMKYCRNNFAASNGEKIIK